MNQPHVYVAMSGGVDSATAVVELLRQGYRVSGVTLRLHEFKDRPGICGSSDDIDAARSVAQTLGIPHTVLDMTELFKKEVMDVFVKEYDQGLTPNPCIDCNRTIKFGALLDWVLEQGGDYLATGHYGRVKEENGVYYLMRSKDPSKDQSYVLYQMNQHHLSHLLLPLGEYSKSTVREMAQEAGLCNAKKPDSQDICFVPDGNYAAFLEGYGQLKLEPGQFVDKTGAVLGTHKGQACYTKGQRRGLGVSAAAPLYVVEKRGNEVVLGSNTDLFETTLRAGRVTWTHENPTPCEVIAKTRFSQTQAPATVTDNGDGTIAVNFHQPQRAITPGQSVVLYTEDDCVLGGGVIL